MPKPEPQPTQEWRDGHAAIEAECRAADLVSILAALQAEMELYLRTGMRVSEGRLILWMHEVRLAAAKAAEGR